jgi:hypothetical protein
MNIVQAMNDPGLFQPWFDGESWSGWRSVLKAASLRSEKLGALSGRMNFGILFSRGAGKSLSFRPCQGSNRFDARIRFNHLWESANLRWPDRCRTTPAFGAEESP